jgi:hypothetical protein
MPVPDVVPGHTRKYLSLTDTANIAHLSRYHLGGLIERGQFPSPDVFIAPIYSGWDGDRVHNFCTEAELIHPDGSKYKKPSGGNNERKALLQTLVAGPYRTRTRVYLGNTLMAAAYNLRAAALYQARDREKFLPADIVVSTRLGWDEEEVLRFGQQSGRIDESDVTKWAVRRTLAWDLPVTDWVWDRAEQTDTQGNLLYPEIRDDLTAAGKWTDRPAPDDDRKP